MSARRDQTKLSVRDDLSASIVIFLVAIPLCLGIALASNTPPISGLITGIVGGIFVGFFSRSQLSVTGPAAGMSVIVLTSIESIGSFDGFLTALILGGILQYLLGLMRFGSVGHFIPSAVVKGVMASIGSERSEMKWPSKLPILSMLVSTITLIPAAGPVTDSWDRLKNPTKMPPTMPVISPEIGGVLEARAMPKQRGIATRKMTILADRSSRTLSFV